jgi:hypothetical protein
MWASLTDRREKIICRGVFEQGTRIWGVCCRTRVPENVSSIELPGMIAPLAFNVAGGEGWRCEAMTEEVADDCSNERQYREDADENVERWRGEIPS